MNYPTTRFIGNGIVYPNGENDARIVLDEEFCTEGHATVWTVAINRGGNLKSQLFSVHESFLNKRVRIHYLRGVNYGTIRVELLEVE